jgi:OOP family OmpA-OmpF porin
MEAIREGARGCGERIHRTRHFTTPTPLKTAFQGVFRRSVPESQSRKYRKKCLYSASLGQNSCFSKTRIAHTNMLKRMACGLAIGTAMAGAFAQTNIQANPTSSAYMQDGRGVIARSQYGMCWRTGYWTPADAAPGCDGELVPPIAKPTAPAIVPPQTAIAAAPAAAPVPAAPVALKRCDFTVTLDSDQAFAFNQAVLSTAARKRIDQEVLPKLASCAKVDLILVTGHTDQLGSQQYNQKLSEKRANMVAAYLKSKGAAAQVDTHGAGKTQPVKSCNGKMSRTKLIACLAPNRRVTIEARGIAG